MTHLKRKLMMTLALLITAATGAWATDYTTLAVGDVIKVGDKFSPTADGAINDNGVESGYIYKLIRADVDNDYYVTEETDGAYYVFEYAAGEFRYIHFEKAFTVTPISDGLVVTNIETEKGKQSYTLALHEPAPAATPFAITWSAATPNTASIDKMPAGNVTVSVDYFPQAAFAMSTDPTPVPLAPTAIADVPANTDDPIVKAGTVANIGTSEVKQGTLMYFVKQPTGNTVPEAPDYDTDGWDENVPTANELKQGDVYVWYYIKGAEPANIADRSDDNTRSDSDIMPLGTSGVVTLGAEPTYDVTLNAEGLSDEEAAAWKVAKGTDQPAAFPLEGVKKSETVTVTYYGTKKIIGVKAEKKANNPYANAKLGDLFYSDGTFSSTLEAGKTPIGVIAYLDQEGTDDDEITEKSNGAGHGLVLCLKDAASGADTQWSTEMVSKFPGQEVTSVDDLKRTENVSGYTNTATLTVDATTAEKYPAAKAAKEYTTLAAPTCTTGWFLPSAQQWVKMIEGLGGLSDGAPNFAESWFDNNHTAADKWEAALSKAGNGNYDSMTSECLYYPSSSEISAEYAVTLGVDATNTGSVYGFLFIGYSKNASMAGIGGRVRPVLAF